MKFIGIIPARYASTRFPGKPLAMLCGKPVIQRVYEQVASVMKDVYVATDDERIFQAVEGFGGKAVMTSASHKSGTDRVEEALQKVGAGSDVVVNIQGDEPFVNASQIDTLCKCFDDDATQIATMCKPYTPDENIADLINPNVVKVVTDKRGWALYFSRNVIPFLRGVPQHEWLRNHTFLKHIGIYAYRSDVLKEITTLKEGTLEEAESLEQLRWLENGYRIKVGLTDVETVGIDTPADLERAEKFLNNHKQEYYY